MTERDPYLALRDFRVWFSKRRGFFEALRQSDPGYVRAVDGIDVTIGKGEIYCLVGESGCGKTTTGKGILQLVEPTGGDVFLNPTPDELAHFDATRSERGSSTWDAFREKRSLTWKEKVRRTPLNQLLHALLATAGLLFGVFVALGLIIALRAMQGTGFDAVAYAGLGLVLVGVLVVVFGYVLRLAPLEWRTRLAVIAILGLAAGLVLLIRAVGGVGLQGAGFIAIGLFAAFAATLPWIKVTPRIRQMLAIGTIPATVLTQILAVGAALGADGAPSDIGAALGRYGSNMLNNDVFIAMIQIAVAAFAAWWFSGFFDGFWDRRRGIVTDRLRALRTRLQIIFQDPYESLNPRHTVYDIVAEPLVVNRITRSRAETEARVEQALHDAGLRPARDYLLRFPHELSGGQRQRVGIAGALVLEPEFLVADEPVSMLDVSIRTEIIELLLQLRTQKGLTYLFITHDLSLAWVLADRIGVMYLGKIVEEGPTVDLISNPRHPYTKALISVVPIPDPDVRHDRIILRGERPDPSDIPRGCRFHPRCPVAFERCGWSPEEILDALKDLAGPGPMAEMLQAAEVDAPLSFRLPPNSGSLESWIREQKAAQAQSHLALKAMRGITGPPNARRVLIYGRETVKLVEIAPGNRVACLLFQ